MREGVVGSVPSHFVFRFLPEETELLLKFSHRTKVENEVPGGLQVNGWIIDVGQQPVRGQLHSSVTRSRQGLREIIFCKENWEILHFRI